MKLAYQGFVCAGAQIMSREVAVAGMCWPDLMLPLTDT